LNVVFILAILTLLCFWLFRCIETVCLTETRYQIPNLAGYKFEILETNCDSIGNDTIVEIRATNSQTGSRYVIMRYGPGPDVMPKIEQISNNEIKISVQEIYSLISKKDTIGDLNILYDVPRIEFPASRK